jgi:thiamine kinase-like enzyme
MIDSVIKNYFPAETNYCVKPFGNGHINDTYKVEFADSSTVYILQRINTLVFKHPEVIIENHLKLQKSFPKAEQQVEIARLIPDSNGKFLFTDKEGGAWRMTSFIDDSYSVDLVDENWQAYQSGLGYGWFAKASSLLNAEDFQEPIKDFHKLSFRLDQLKNAIKADKVRRLKSVEPIVRFFEIREKSLMQIEKLIDKGEIPIRVVHNDTKINNVLFRNNKAVSVIDLDTVGPGSIMFDYGDALRTSANNAAEDEKKLEKVSLNLDSFKAFTNGYLSQVKDILTDKEKVYLSKAPVLMTYIMGIRFLADYLNGDEYYKTAYADHNLDRAKVQKKLIESMESHEMIMKRIIHESLKGN